MIIRVCMLCRAEYGRVDDGLPEVRESHGVCPRCEPKWSQDMERQIAEYQESDHDPR